MRKILCQLPAKFKNISNFRAMATTTDAADDVLVENVSDKGILILNRPKALNSLNLSMVTKIHKALIKWEHEKTLVIIKGVGDKAFCAGGDVRAASQNASAGQDFFKLEYITNGVIGSYKIPYIAFIDGIVMGGGVGVSVHGHYRIATERTLFAMPETQIGLFPDVGGSYFLPRLGGQLGLYLALTGHRLKGSDVLKAGIATHYCNSSSLKELERVLLTCKKEEEIKTTLNKFHVKDTSQFSLEPYMKQINQCFSAPTMEEIVLRLKQDGSDFAKKALETFAKMSPTSLKITLKQLSLGKHLTLQECLEMEYRLAVHVLRNKDFYEGVRALLIDKDQSPKWNPATLEEVTDKFVDEHFERLSDGLELKHKL